MADLSTKYAFLKGGVGWGSMPMHMVDQDIMAGTLVVLDTDDMPKSGFMLSMSAVYPAASPPGPAGRWLIQLLNGDADASPEDMI